jgi:hypothetical protein
MVGYAVDIGAACEQTLDVPSIPRSGLEVQGS